MDIVGILAALATRAQTLGVFERVIRHQPLAAPGSGVSLALYAASEPIVPIPAHSGLAATSVRLTFTARLYLSAEIEPRDDVETRILGATSDYLNDLTGHFTLGATVAAIDLLGIHGQALDTTAGYAQFAEGWYRVVTITIPIIINDAWTQTA